MILILPYVPMTISFLKIPEILHVSESYPPWEGKAQKYLTLHLKELKNKVQSKKKEVNRKIKVDINGKETEKPTKD